MDSLFQRSLNDVLKTLRLQASTSGLRASSSSRAATEAFLTQVYKESLKECRSTDAQVKATALQKLLFLHMARGTDLQPAAFHCVEAMGSSKFFPKSQGYLVGAECLQEQPDMLLLATHSLRKDLGSPSQHETGFALSYLACVSSPDLALDIGPDVLALLQGSRAAVRRKATLALLRMVQRSPEMLRSAFRALLERLEDSSPGVVTAAVCVLCELALHDPPAFLPLAPSLVPLLTPQASPWLAIKLVKIIGALAQVEPRLVRKVQDPLTAVLQSTPSKSLLLETVRCVLSCMPHSAALCQLALAKAAELLETGDANVRYLALQTLLAALPQHAADIAPHKAAVIGCFDHPDASVQSLTLRLVAALVSESSLLPTVSVLRARLPAAAAAGMPLAAEIEGAILQMCSADSFARITDFPWYLGVLTDLCYLPSSRQGVQIGRQLVELAVRVPGLIPDLLRASRRLLMDAPLLGPRPSGPHVLASAALLLGEHGAHPGLAPAPQPPLLQQQQQQGKEGQEQVQQEQEKGQQQGERGGRWGEGGPAEGKWREEVRANVEPLLQPALLSLAPTLQAVCVQAAMKLVVRAASTSTLPAPTTSSAATVFAPGTAPTPLAGPTANGSPGVGPESTAGTPGTPVSSLLGKQAGLELAGRALEWLRPFRVSPHLEVQERAGGAEAVLLALQEELTEEEGEGGKGGRGGGGGGTAGTGSAGADPFQGLSGLEALQSTSLAALGPPYGVPAQSSTPTPIPAPLASLFRESPLAPPAQREREQSRSPPGVLSLPGAGGKQWSLQESRSVVASLLARAASQSTAELAGCGAQEAYQGGPPGAASGPGEAWRWVSDRVSFTGSSRYAAGVPGVGTRGQGSGATRARSEGALPGLVASGAADVAGAPGRGAQDPRLSPFYLGVSDKKEGATELMNGSGTGGGGAGSAGISVNHVEDVRSGPMALAGLLEESLVPAVRTHEVLPLGDLKARQQQ